MTDAIGNFTAVSLDDVVGTAPLLTRIDHKYVVPLSGLDEVLAKLDMPVLEIEGQREFQYESVYFDTPDWTTYLASAWRRRKRVKVRTRTYVDSGVCMLELKSKGYRDQTVKERIEYDVNDRATLTADGCAFLVERAAGLAHGSLRAALITSYRRSSFADLTLGARATIDTDLVCEDATGRRVGMPGYAIVETKSSNGSCPTDRMLWRAGFRPESISKYGLGVAALHPHLPRNKWHRPLGHYVREVQ
jgi:VTC domain